MRTTLAENVPGIGVTGRLMLAALLLLAATAAVPAAPPPSRAPVPGIALEGVAIDPLGRALADVEIRLVPAARQSHPGRLRTVRSDEKGRFRVADLEPGAYRLIAVKGGYAVLVGQIDTLLRRSLELVLRPAGDPGPPGSRPPDASWALRLPVRDRLESLEACATRQEEGGAGGRPPVVVEFTASQRAGTATEVGAGVTGGFAGAFDLGGRGVLGAAVRHREEGLDGQLSDDADDLLLRYSPSGPAPAMPLAIQLELGRSARSRPSGPRATPAETGVAEAVARAAWRAPGGELGVGATLSAWHGRQRLPGVARVLDEARGAYRVALDLERSTERPTGRRTRVSARLQHAGGALERREGEAPLAAPTFTEGEGAERLEDLAGTALALSVEDAWPAASGRAEIRAQLGARVDRPHAAGARQLGAVAMGVRYEVAPALALTVDGGFVTGLPRQGAAVYRVGLGGDIGRLSWSIARAREFGFSPWDAAGEGGRWSPGRLPVVAGLSARIDNWIVEAGMASHGRLPGFHLRGSRFAIAGEAAVRLDGDLPFVTVAGDASGAGTLVDLAIDHARTGTLVELSWQTLEGPRSGGLLDGLGGWSSRIVRLRQRIGDAFGERATWHLLIGMEETGVDETADSARVALLEKRRLSGGLSVAF